jgi:hypothetical protein
VAAAAAAAALLSDGEGLAVLWAAAAKGPVSKGKAGGAAGVVTDASCSSSSLWHSCTLQLAWQSCLQAWHHVRVKLLRAQQGQCSS